MRGGAAVCSDVPSPLGPYRTRPAAPRALAAQAPRWIGGAIVAAGLLAAGAWIAPGTTAALLGGLALYVLVPWFITRAPGR